MAAASRACSARTARSKSAKGGFSIEPFVLSDGKLVELGRRARSRSRCRTATCRSPACTGSTRASSCDVTAFAQGTPGAVATVARYRLTQHRPRERARLRAGARAAAVAGQPAEPVPQHRRRRQSDPRTAASTGDGVDASTASRAVFARHAPRRGVRDAASTPAWSTAHLARRRDCPTRGIASTIRPAWPPARCCTACAWRRAKRARSRLALPLAGDAMPLPAASTARRSCKREVAAGLARQARSRRSCSVPRAGPARWSTRCAPRWRTC